MYCRLILLTIYISNKQITKVYKENINKYTNINTYTFI